MESSTARKTASETSAAKTQQKPSQFTLSRAQVRKITNSAEGARDRSIVRMLADTAIRRAELVALDIRDLNLERRQLVVRSGKGQKRRVVPFTDELASDLRIYLDRRTTGPLFLSQRRTALSVRQLNRIVKRVGELAGVRHPNPDSDGAITPHLFRHTFARHWKQAGGDIESLRNILGHAHATTTIDLYGSLSMDDIQSTYDRLRGQHLDDETNKTSASPDSPRGPMQA